MKKKGNKSPKPAPASTALVVQPAPADGPPATEPPRAETPIPEDAARAGDAEAKTEAPRTELPAEPDGVAERAPDTQQAAPAQIPSGDGEGAPSFPIVGIGASAGGLAALEALFAHMPSDSDTGIAFVIVQHLDPDHKSILSELVRRYTRMRVFEVEHGMVIEPNCAYIIPPNKDLAVAGDRLHLTEPGHRRGLRLPIDFFFRSLAQSCGDQAIGIILSGNGTDGTLGLRAIKEAGGMAVVQDPASAEYDGMPRSAIASGLADYVLPPPEIPNQLITYVRRTSTLLKAPPPGAPPPVVNGWLLKIMGLLRSHTGHDFTNYKQNTIRRRVERRMVVNQIETLGHYMEFLRQKPAELDVLFRELLIGVTSFFRDPAAFEALRELALLPLASDHPPGQPIRVCVPGCSTGEEAFSIAILFQEISEQFDRNFDVQIFATDIDRDSIEKARVGIYPANIAADVSPERLKRFFNREENDFYRIKKPLRDQLIFAEQDVIKDPPFSKLNLISCRNMLIYMEPVLQRRLVPLFHYALSPGGFLLLGNSESVGEFTNLFTPVERKWKLYRRKDLNLGPVGNYSVPRLPLIENHPPLSGTPSESKDKAPSLRELTERLLLRSYAPACVAVNEEGEILYVHGRTGKFLELPPGEISLNVVRAAREGLKIELANALRRVIAHREPVHYQGLEVRTNGGFERVNVTVEPAEGAGGPSRVILITFQEASPKPLPKLPAAPAETPKASSPPSEKDRHIAALERELHIKSETLQTTIEELETSNEELKSTNEELQSTNEELQSTNEELETSKEELQSVNEELVTVNTELQQKMDGLARANNDMNNLLAGTGIGMLYVDHELRIQRFTPATTEIIKLIQTDIGRPVSDLVHNLVGYDHLGQDVKSVLDRLTPRETEVQNRDGRWYLMRILPYRTLENVIEGAVLTFVDISAQKRAEKQFRELSDELDRRVNERTAELERANQDLQREISQRREVETRRLAEIAALTHLHDLTTQMAHEDTTQKLLHAALDAAIELTRAEMGTLQLYDEPSQSLRLAAHRGFRPPYLEHFGTVTAQTPSPCAQAMRARERVVIDDVDQSSLREDSLALSVLQAAKVRAVQSTPVLARDGRLLAMVSTHWKQACHPDEGTLRLLDLLARQLADLLENPNERTGSGKSP